MKEEKLQEIPQKYKLIIRNYDQLYTNKTDKLEEMDKLLEMYNFPRLNQEEIETMNRPITSNQLG